MNATLLCPGPTLANFTGDRRGMVVAVNRAAEAHHCDVWAASDWPLIIKTKPLGGPVLLTIQATKDALQRKGEAWPFGVITHSSIAGGTIDNGRHPWTRYTATAALQYLAWSGATHVDVWGCDWAGREDWDGHTAKSDNRTTDRWRDERKIWDGVISANQLSITRHR